MTWNIPWWMVNVVEICENSIWRSPYAYNCVRFQKWWSQSFLYQCHTLLQIDTLYGRHSYKVKNLHILYRWLCYRIYIAEIAQDYTGDKNCLWNNVKSFFGTYRSVFMNNAKPLNAIKLSEVCCFNLNFPLRQNKSL